MVILAMVPLLVTARKVGTLLMVEFLINFPGVNHTADHMLGVWSVKCARVLLKKSANEFFPEEQDDVYEINAGSIVKKWKMLKFVVEM